VGKLDELLKPENKAELSKILKYHVIAGEYFASVFLLTVAQKQQTKQRLTITTKLCQSPRTPISFQRW